MKNNLFTEEVKKKIRNLKLQYASTPYNRENIDQIDIVQLQLTISDQMFLELLLLEIRSTAMFLSSQIKKKNEEKVKKLVKEIKILEELAQSYPDTDNNILTQLLSEAKSELEQIRKDNLKGSVLRSKANWIENGEKPSKYFCALEKRNYVNKTVMEITNEQGEK